jgi:hypothetical protein
MIKRASKYVGNRVGTAAGLAAVFVLGQVLIDCAILVFSKVHNGVSTYIGPAPTLSDTDED